MLLQFWWNHKIELSEDKGDNLRKTDSSSKKYKKFKKNLWNLFRQVSPKELLGEEKCEEKNEIDLSIGKN